MTIFQAIRGAAGRVSLRKRMMVAYWFFHTLMAALVALPLMGAVSATLGHSRYGAELLRGFDFSGMVELIQYDHGSQFTVLTPALMLTLFLLMLGSIFLAGGAVKMLVYDGPDYSPRMFYEGCGRYFWRFLRLALYSLFFYGIALAVRGLLLKASNKVWGEGMESHQTILAGWAISALLLVLLGVVNTAMDYAKVRLVVDDSRKSLRACFGSMNLVLTNLGKTMGVWLVLTLFYVVFLSIYIPLANMLQDGGAGALVPLIVLQQLYVFSRVWLRMLAWGSAAELDPFVRPKPELPPEPVLVPVPAAPQPPELSAGAEAEPETGPEPEV